jgi:hypothetical protein
MVRRAALRARQGCRALATTSPPPPSAAPPALPLGECALLQHLLASFAAHDLGRDGYHCAERPRADDPGYGHLPGGGRPTIRYAALVHLA